MDRKYTYEDFPAIIETLRSPGGCPWDREQSHESLRPCLLEETAEVMAAIRILGETGDSENLREELGDVLLQVVMHAQIAKEEGLFTMEDVVQEVAEKMVRRHPHVFGEVTVSGSGQVLENWEEIKRGEKEGKKTVLSPLREIPMELPALARAVKVLKKKDKLYEKGKSFDQAAEDLKRAAERLMDLGQDGKKDALENGIGDVLMAVSELSRITKLPQEQILTDRICEMIQQYEG